MRSPKIEEILPAIAYDFEYKTQKSKKMVRREKVGNFFYKPQNKKNSKLRDKVSKVRDRILNGKN
jgi:hypothetical protein